MKKQAYLTGYTGRPTRTPQQLLRLAEMLDATVIDSRYNAMSRIPHWNGGPMRRVLGSHYLWVREFGNLGYKEGYIKLVNPQRGLDLLTVNRAERFIILCACQNGETCHRKHVGEYLSQHGWEVREVTTDEWKQAAADATFQPTLLKG